MVSPAFAMALGDVAVTILALLAGVHLYWALGGRWGKDAAVPEIPKTNTPLFRPRKTATLLVAAALAVSAALVALRIGLMTSPIPDWVPRLACIALAIVFLARAIGDFRYVGFFKRVRGTKFARLDTAAYAPLCLFLAICVGLNAL